MGVSIKCPLDPLGKLLLSNDFNKYKQPQYKHERKLFTYNGLAIARLEVSFYGD